MRLKPALAAILPLALLAACASQPSPPPPPPPEEPPGVPAPVQPNPPQSPITGTVIASVPPRPEQPSIRDVTFATTERGWILLGEQVLATMDGGDTWAPAATTSWPIPERGGGKTWERLPDPCPPDSRKPFSFISPTSGWLLCGFDEGAGAMSKRLYRTEDGGQTWILLGEALVDRNGQPSKAEAWPGGLGVGDYVADLFFVDEHHGWYTGARYGSFMTTRDGGHTWQRADGPSLRFSQVRFITPQVGYRFGLDTMQAAPWVLTMTRDSGKTWSQVYPRRQPLERFYLDAQTSIGELDGALYRSDDAGGSWQLLSRLPAPLISLSFASREHAWALMGMEQDRHLYRSADGGATWARVTAEDQLASFRSVQGLDHRTAVLWGGTRLLITSDGGASFAARATPTEQPGGYGFFFASADVGWFSWNFDLYTTADGAVTWQRIPLQEYWNAQGVAAGPDGRLWASIVDTADRDRPALLTLASADGGKTWTRYDLGDFNQPWPVSRCGLSSICVESGGFRHGIVSHDGGQTWRYYQR